MTRVTAFLSGDRSGYTILDDWYERASNFLTHTPYWVLALMTAFLFAIFIYGLAKRLVVFTVLVGLLIVAICAVWFVAGHAVS